MRMPAIVMLWPGSDHRLDLEGHQLSGSRSTAMVGAWEGDVIIPELNSMGMLGLRSTLQLVDPWV